MPKANVMQRDVVAIDQNWWDDQQHRIRRALELCKEAKRLCTEDYAQEPLDMETAINLLHQKVKELTELLDECEVPF
jgi:hypothetical protein